MAVRMEEVRERQYILAASNDLAVEAFVKLAFAQCERLHVKLEVCTPEELPGVQGELRAYKNVMKWAREPLLNQPVDK